MARSGRHQRTSVRIRGPCDRARLGGYLAAEQGDDAVELLEASRRCALDAGALKIAAQATSHLSVFLPVDRRDEMVALGEEAVALARASGSRWILGIALNNLGEVFREVGDDRRALGAYEESYTVRREIGDKSLIALSLINLSEMAVAAGDLDRARSLSFPGARLRGAAFGSTPRLVRAGGPRLDRAGRWARA